MKLRTQIQFLISYFLDKGNVGQIIFYLACAGVILYFSGLRSLLLLSLFLFSILSFSKFLLEIFFVIKNKKIGKHLIISSVLFVLFLSLSLMFLPLKILLYAIIISIIIVGLSVYDN